jgi:hypothetical protein
MASGIINSAPQTSLQEVEDEFNRLTCEEKEDILKDMYGDNYYNVVETDETQRRGLQQFDLEIDKIPNNSTGKNHYLRGLEINPNYVRSDGLRLQFLRRELFNAKVCIFCFCHQTKTQFIS